jgi:predicted acetyltransferase
MHLTLTPVPLEEKPILEQLMQLYQYDFTEFDGADADEQGLFPYYDLPAYWIDPSRRPFLLRANGKLAGFVLVRLNIKGRIDPPRPVNQIAEFFVMQKYRRHGIGEFAAKWVFDQFPGDWEVEQLAANLPAQTFWRKIIGRYTNNQFREVYFHDDHHHGPIQTFRYQYSVASVQSIE